MWWYWPPCACYGVAAEHTWRAKARPKAAPSPCSLVSEGSSSNRASCSVRAGARAASWGRVTRSWVAAWVTCFSRSSLLPAGLIWCHKVQQLRVPSWKQDIWWYGRTSLLLLRAGLTVTKAAANGGSLARYISVGCMGAALAHMHHRVGRAQQPTALLPDLPAAP